MKKIHVLSFVTVAALALWLSAQDTGSSQSPAPSSQSTTAVSSKTASNDGDLTQQLQSRFGQDPAFANVQVSVSNGTATITGSVPAKADKKRAKEMAKSIAGVKHVKEQLTVNPSAGNSTNSSKDNNPTDAGVRSGSIDNSSTASTSSSATSPSAGSTNADQSTGSADRNATNPANAQTSATSSNPNSQESSTTGAAAAAGATQQPMTAGAISANAGGAASTTTAAGDMGVSVSDAATLQNQIQNALQNEPTLRNDNLNVTVTDSTIELSGNVQNGKEKQTARRIASSFAGNRRVKDRIALSGKGSAASSPGPSGVEANPAGRANPNPNSNPNSQNPSANNPKANGDASANPR